MLSTFDIWPFNLVCSFLQAIFAETLVDNKDEFLQKYLTDKDFVRYEDFADFYDTWNEISFIKL